MKRILILTFAIVFSFCSCASNPTATHKEKIKINMPKDNTVNGYRTKEPTKETQNGMPDKINGNDVWFESNKEIASSKDESDKNKGYCGNKNSKKFHKSSCGALKNTKEENKVYLGSKQDYLNEGYSACKLCKP